MQNVLDQLDEEREDLARLCLELGNTVAPFGSESIIARQVHAWYEAQNIASEFVPISDNRANVVARIAGDGSGKSLIFNAHLDTEASGADFENLMGSWPDPNLVGAWRDGDFLFGQTILNDRGCMAAFMIAARAIAASGLRLQGDLIFTSVAGETGAAPVDEYQGVAYEGKGLGSNFLLAHGLQGDYALVAETTDFASCWSNLGAVYYKVTVRGKNIYTPRLVRPEGTLRDHPNAIVKAATLVQALEHWAIEFERQRANEGPCGPVAPRAQIGAVRGGIPWRPNRSSPYCALYMDVRLLPGEPVDEVTTAIEAVIADVGIPAEVEPIMVRQGATASAGEIEPLREAVRNAYEHVRGVPQPNAVETAVASMWRDNNLFNEHGIPSLTFGPSRGSAVAQGSGSFALDDLVDVAKMYALIGIEIAGGVSGPIPPG